MRIRKLSSRLPLMSASLLMAILVWVLVIAEEKIEAGFMAPLVFDNIPASVVIDGTPIGSVYVQLRGSKQAVSSLLPQQIRAHVDLSRSKPGNEFVQLTSQDIVLPVGLTVLGVYPPYLDLKFLAKKPVTVQVRTVGRPAEGFLLKSVASFPRQVEIVGPLQRVEVIEGVETYPIDINGREKRMKVQTELVQPGDDIRILQLKPTEVLVAFEAKMLKRTIGKVPVLASNENVKFSPASIRVVVEGPYRQVKDLAPEKIEVRVDWEANQENSIRPLIVTVPEGITVISTSPDKVSVK